MAATAVQGGTLRVMHVMHELRFGGMELGVVKLVNAMSRDRIANSICSCRPATNARARLAADIPLFELRRRDGNDPLLIGRLARLMRRVRPHIVHTHAWGTLCEGLLAARIARVPIVVHGEHGTLNTVARNKIVQRWAWSRVDQVLSVSSTLAERMAGEVGFPLERIRTIRNGVDLRRFAASDRTATRTALGIAPSTFVVGTVGRLVPVKNHVMLLRAVALLRARGVPVLAVVVGDGPLRAELEQRIAADNLAEYVRLLGERSDVERILPAFDVFTLTSRSEGLSNTIQEAMACGVPVVATRVGGAGELLEEGRSGMLVPSDDAGALAGALESLANAPERQAQLGRAAKERAIQHFALSRMISNYEALYFELARRRGLSAVQTTADRGTTDLSKRLNEDSPPAS